MEDDLNIFENGRQPTKMSTCKTTSNILKMEENLRKNNQKQ